MHVKADVLKGLVHTRFGLSPSLSWVFGAAAAGGVGVGGVDVVVELKGNCSSERL